ncbi:NTP transferase domain-containing protein [Natronoarchaeum sp. GCM10025703]|uniref:NTP transferase domain-containing protein n=1 Tax=unclassified Natronoarchaeum TaxID=2620183 RepID=UPI00360CCF9C
MCGGEGTRLADSLPATDSAWEKPLYRIGGVPMIDRVLGALTESRIKQVHAVVSPASPETHAHLAGRVSLIETPGEGYVADLSVALDAVEQPVLTVAADLPLLTGDTVDDVLETYADAGDIDGEHGSMTVAVPESLKTDLGVSSDTVVERGAIEGELVDARDDPAGRPDRIAPTGVNVVGDPRGSTDRMYLTADNRLAVNVNRARDARVAEAML